MADVQAQTGPLKGLRVIDLGTMIAGPVAATMMGDFGAEVIKVEQPDGGDTIRGIGPFVDDECLWWQVEGRNKKTMTLNLREAAGQEILKKLVAQSDVLIENFRPGTMDKWGIGYEVLSQINPGLIMLSISGFGQSGPYAGRASYDRIALAFSGIMAVTGYEDRPPVRIGNSMADYSTATMGAYAVMMALYHRDAHGGKGQQIDLALYEPMFRYTDSMALSYQKLGRVRERTGNLHHAAVPGDNFRTKDGRYLILTISGNVLFRKLCAALGTPELADEPEYATHASRWQHVDELNKRVSDWVGAADVAEVTAALDQHGIPYSIVLNIADIFADPHYQARGNIQTVVHPRLGPLQMQGVVPRLTGTPAGPIEPARDVGEDNETVLREILGLSGSQIDDLRRRKII